MSHLKIEFEAVSARCPSPKRLKPNSLREILKEAKDERVKLEEELKLRLERLSPVKQMEKEALISENLNKQLKFRAFPSPYNVI